MNSMPHNMEDILNCCVSGFHQYVLSAPVHLSFVSQSLCSMLGVCETELLHDSRDLYALLVHPSDRRLYTDFIHALRQKEQTLTAEYRLVKRDGSVIFVKDTATSQLTNDGTLCACSVLADITDIKAENSSFQFLNSAIPCGLLKYTCEKTPRITYINRNMLDILRLPDSKSGELDYLELYKSNIFLMIPMEERRRFSMYLKRVYSEGTPIAGEITLLRCDGTRAYIFGLVTRGVNEQGLDEFQSICMDITDRHRERKTSETQRYIKALTDVYDKIFEFNIGANTVKCLYCNDSPTFRGFENVAIQLDDAIEKYIIDSVVADEQEEMRSFFSAFCQKRLYSSGARPPQITYHASSSHGGIKAYTGIFIMLDEMTSLFCCRPAPDYADDEALRTENDQLKQNIKDLVLRFRDGIAAFEVTPENTVIPLYASDNVCEFFGYTREEWLPLMKTATPIEKFVAYSDVSYEDFAELLRSGEAEFTYYDFKTESERRIKAICSQKGPSGSSSRYVMLYSVEDGRHGQEQAQNAMPPENRTVSIRTFGYFDVFVGDRPIAFKNKKSKELFALLVDRRGGYVTSDEAIGFLWEDEPVNSVTLSRYRKVALRLKNALEEYGISDVIETIDGKRRIVPERVSCDLYDYLSDKDGHNHLFKGSYLTNYSWGETTLAELTGNIYAKEDR